MREKLTLVTDPATLKVGDYVELRRCLQCGKTHRGIIVSFDSEPPAGWLYLPGGSHAITPWFKTTAVAERRIYLINCETLDQAVTREEELCKTNS